jgi:O-antigen ligase
VFAIGQIGKFLIALSDHAIYVDAAPAFLNTSANAVALYLEPPLAFGVGFILFPAAKRDRWIATIFSALVLAAIILSLSRAGFLALAVFALMVLLSIPSWKWQLGTVVAMAVIALGVTALPFIRERLSTFAHSASLRTSIYAQALHMLSQRPIQGAGISGFPIAVAPLRPGSQEIELYPHNLWLTTWSELGLLGLLSFAVIFFGLMWQGFRSLPRSLGLSRPVIWGATGALILYLVHGMFDSPYWKNDLSVEFWLLAALMVIGVRGGRDQSLDDVEPHRARSSS